MPKKAKSLKAKLYPRATSAAGSHPSTIASPRLPVEAGKGILPVLISLALLAVVFSMTFDSSIRMTRLWFNHDEFERHKLDFNIGGVPAEWGYAAWAGLFGETLTRFGLTDGGFVGELLLKNLPPVLNHNIEGGPLVINTAVFPSGIGTHAPGKIAFSLQGKFSRFSCLVGLDTTSVSSQGAIYTVIADGREIFRSPKLRLDADTFPIDVSVVGVHELVLNAIQAEFTNTGCNVDWVDLKFIP